MSRAHYLKHLLLSMGTRLAMIGLRLLRNVLLARILGPSERGLFALLSTLPDLISAATSGGLNSAVGYQAAQQRSMGLLLSQVLVFGCLLAGLLTLLVVALVREFGGELDIATQLGLLAWLLLLAVPLTVLKSGLLTLHNASGGVGAFNALRLMESLAPLLLFLVLFWMWKDAALEAALIRSGRVLSKANSPRSLGPRIRASSTLRSRRRPIIARRVPMLSARCLR